MNPIKSLQQCIEKQIEDLDAEYQVNRKKLDIQLRKLHLEYELDALVQQERQLEQDQIISESYDDRN